MLLTDLQSVLVARLMSDAYFASPENGVAVFAENRLDLAAELDQQLARLGMGAVVAIGQVVGGEHYNELIVSVVVDVMEIPTINRADTGTQKVAEDVLVKMISLWDKPWIPSEAWMPLELVSYSRPTVDLDNAAIMRTIEFQTRTYRETVVQGLATEGGEILGTEGGAALIVSPTSA